MPIPDVTPDQIVRGAAAALADVARLEALTGGCCHETRSFLVGVLLTACENVRGTPVHTPMADLLAQARMDLPTKLEPRVLPAVWLATARTEKGDERVLLRAWESEGAARDWRDRNAEGLDALGFPEVALTLAPVLGKEP